MDMFEKVKGIIVEQLGVDLLHANSLSMARLVGPVARSLGVVSLGHLRDILRLSSKTTWLTQSASRS